MLCNGFLLTIELVPLSPRPIFACLAMLCVVALAGIALTDLPTLERFVLGSVLLGLLPLIPVPQVDRIVWPLGRPCRLFMGDGEPCSAELRSAWIVGGVAGLLWQTDTGQRVPVWFVKTRLLPDGWRHLRVRLHFPASGVV
jgi:hypothetical protein